MFDLNLSFLASCIIFASHLISVIFVIFLGAALHFKFNRQNKIKIDANPKESLDVIIPIYKEEPALIKKCLDSLVKQSKLSINLICIMKDADAEQIRLLKSYSRRLSKIKILVQKGKPSQNRAYIEALKNANTKYVCILNADAELEDESLRKLVSYAYQTDANVSFGIIMPKCLSKFSKFMGIRKLFGQYLLMGCRGRLGLGYYVPGCICIFRRDVLLSELQRPEAKNSFASYDVYMMLRLYSHKSEKISFLPIVAGTELEKSSFWAAVLQIARWFLGTVCAFGSIGDLILKSRLKIKLGTVMLIWTWYILPFSMVLGLILSLFTSSSFLLAYIFTYACLTLVLFMVPNARGYGLKYCIPYWLVHSVIVFLGMFLSIYIFFIDRYRSNHLYTVSKR